MKKRFEDLNVRLIQVRLMPDIEAEEFETFLDRTGLQRDQLHRTNVLHETVSQSILDDMDVVMIGGAGAYSVTHTYGWTQDLVDLVIEIRDRKLPLFGSCWGHQFIARALGGSVIYDPERSEIGCLPVELTEAGLADPLFDGFPQHFFANMGHQDRVERLPEGSIELARSPVCGYQAFRILGSPIYGTQFHSELNAETERARLYAYRRHYPSLHDDQDFASIVATLRETTEVDRLLHLFLVRFAVSPI
jgi:GMP synthase (glutamine-hydrolysing)